ncbi:MAG: HipA domain-containing protein [Candidatus Aureabacteria bacterium]|nr:HipA domain-containing protein [Candidatus Auribacterota bacterium]
MSKVLIQNPKEIIEIDDWRIAEDNKIYPEGSKEKSLYIAPNERIYDFIIPNHKYLFKLSYSRYPEQFWVEIIAYKLGCLAGVEVPPTFVAIDKGTMRVGALVEWFFSYPGYSTELKMSGANYMQMLISNYDRDKGIQHNLKSIKTLHSFLKKSFSFNFNWPEYWAKTLAFDALIGNTDRHQDNWGIIWSYKDKKPFPKRMTPVFDNGTSMGHEILERNFDSFNEPSRLEKYVLKGTHHMKWSLDEDVRIGHVELIKRFICEHPEVIDAVKRILYFDEEKLNNAIMELTTFNVYCKLSEKRANFIEKLLIYRRNNLIEKLKI